MTRKARDPQTRIARRLFRRKAIALCNSKGVFFASSPRDSVLIEHCLDFLRLQPGANKLKTKMYLLQAMGVTIIDTPAKPKKPPHAPKPVKSFYEGREWRELRYQVLVKNNGKCECCGAGKHNGKMLHVDHILPRSLFPDRELDLTNLQVLCEDCNLGKSNKDVTDWREVPS